MNELWSHLASRANVSLSEAQDASLSRYLDLLEQANQRMNLTRITRRDAAEVQHIADALTLLPHLPPGPISLADIGSGAGVPGIPLAIVRPEMSVVLIESTKKKAAFLCEVTQALELKNVTVLDQRAETVARSNKRETFDISVARAVGALVWIAEWCLPLTKKGGKVLVMKGEKVHEELPAALKATKLLGGAEPVIHPVQLPGIEHHVIVEILKTFRTDMRYPRNPTTTKGKPLP